MVNDMSDNDEMEGKELLDEKFLEKYGVPKHPKIIEIENLEDKVGDVDFPWITGWKVFLAILALELILNWLFKVPQQLQLFALFFNGIILWIGFVKAQHTERLVIERVGKYWKVLGPGLHILIPWVDEIVVRLNTKAKKLPLFGRVNKDPKKTVDFKKTAELGVDFGAWYVIADAQRAAYFTGNLEEFIGDTVENIARRVFGETHIGDALESKFEVERKTNGYLFTSLGELANNLDKRYLEILHISLEEAKKMSSSVLLMLAGVRITQIYFTDVDLCDETIKARTEIFQTIQKQKVTKEQEIVEKDQVKVEEQKEKQEVIKGRASGKHKKEEIEALMEKGLTPQEAIAYLVDTKKYGKGVDQISEINIGSGGDKDSAEAMAAKMAAIFGKTAQEASSQNTTGSKKPKQQETESEQ